MEKDIIREAKIKAARFCAYRERAPAEVREKLGRIGLMPDQQERVVNELIDENFINEQRFATAYANGKLRINKWGKIKIRHGLESYRIGDQCIEQALNALPEDEYLSVMVALMKNKQASLGIADPYVRNHKVVRFLISKGFEPDLVWNYVKSKS
jgi:regulatory protein